MNEKKTGQDVVTNIRMRCYQLLHCAYRINVLVVSVQQNSPLKYFTYKRAGLSFLFNFLQIQRQYSQPTIRLFNKTTVVEIRREAVNMSQYCPVYCVITVAIMILGLGPSAITDRNDKYISIFTLFKSHKFIRFK